MSILFADASRRPRWWPGPPNGAIDDLPEDPIKVCQLTRTERNRCIALHGRCADRIERHFRCLEQYYPKERVRTLRREFRSPAFIVGVEDHNQPFLWWRTFAQPYFYYLEHKRGMPLPMDMGPDSGARSVQSV